MNEWIDSLFYAYTARLSGAPTRHGGIALTIPSLEPTYPVPGGQAPAYLLPAIAKHEGRRGHSSALAGDSIAGLKMLGNERRVGRVLDELCLVYQGYKSRCSVLRKLDREAQYDSSEKSAQVERRQMLISDRDNLRKQLVELVGEDAVNNLDADPAFLN